jgi:hypothetical protein
VALETVQDYVDEARTILQDSASPQRYTDVEMVRELNLAILEARRLRHDLFFGYSKKNPYPQFSADHMDALVPFEEMYRQAITYYLVGKCTLRDEEDTDDKRGAGFVQKFTGQLITLPG